MRLGEVAEENPSRGWWRRGHRDSGGRQWGGKGKGTARLSCYRSRGLRGFWRPLQGKAPASGLGQGRGKSVTFHLAARERETGFIPQEGGKGGGGSQ